MATSRAPFITMDTISPTTSQHRLPSPWHSPAPYLFGGLAVISCLIAIAIFLLTGCSYYWKLSTSFLGVSDRDREPDIESSGDGNCVDVWNRLPPAGVEELFLVIMAGEVKPSFIATPGSSSNKSTLDCGQIKAEQGDGDQLQSVISS